MIRRFAKPIADHPLVEGFFQSALLRYDQSTSTISIPALLSGQSREGVAHEMALKVEHYVTYICTIDERWILISSTHEELSSCFPEDYKIISMSSLLNLF